MYENIPAWVADYIGIPFAEKGRDRKGCDCWGLVRIACGEHYGFWLPLYADGYESTKDGEAIEKIITREAVKFKEISDPLEGDFVVCRILGLPWHIGLVVAPGVMLHTEAGIESSLDDLTGLRWRNRIEGYYRHDG